MTIATSPVETQPLLLDVSNTTLHVTPEQFDKLCIDNPDLRLELTATGELIVMPPAFPISGEQNGDLFGRVWYWNEQTELGRVFDSSTGYDFTAIGGGKVIAGCTVDREIAVRRRSPRSVFGSRARFYYRTALDYRSIKYITSQDAGISAIGHKMGIIGKSSRQTGRDLSSGTTRDGTPRMPHVCQL